MRHYVLTRSAYGPLWSPEENRRRLDLMIGITARSLAAQTAQDFTWIVVVGQEDPLREERTELVNSIGRGSRVIKFATENADRRAPWDNRTPNPRTDLRERVAYEAYRAGWAQAMGLPSWELTLMTRIDDDDAFAPDALERMRFAAKTMGGARRCAFLLPVGIRTWRGRYSVVRHETNAMGSLRTHGGDRTTIYDFGHMKVRQHAQVNLLGDAPGWLWVRHQNTLSGHKQAALALTSSIRSLFPIDWGLLEQKDEVAA